MRFRIVRVSSRMYGSLGQEIMSPVGDERVVVLTTGFRHEPGKPDVLRAIRAYPYEHLQAWNRDLGSSFKSGDLGEHLTLETFEGSDAMPEDSVRLGDVFWWGSQVVLQISRCGQPWGLSAAQVTRTGRCGWAFRVLRHGIAPVGGELKRVITDPFAPTIADSFLRHAQRGMV